MDNLEENPFYSILVTDFRKEFQFACNSSYVIAIPHHDILETAKIDNFLINSHILMPSKLLKMHYTPLQAGFCDDIEISDKKMLLHWTGDRSSLKKHHVINILNQEVGYNRYNKEYRLLLIDQLLVDQKRYKSMFSLGAKGMKNVKLPKQLENHDDCLKFLQSISKYITTKLEADVKLLQKNYMILSHFLQDAAVRIKNQIDNYVKKYESSINNVSIISQAIRLAIQLATENYTVHLLHGKIMVSVYRLYDEKDRLLLENLNEIYESNLTIDQLGAQKVFSEFSASEPILAELNRLPYLQSPLAIVYGLSKLVDLISYELELSVKFKVLLGDVNKSSKGTISICSDDLIASFVYSIAKARPPRLYSTSKYLEVFGWSSSSKDQAAYYTATFHIVVRYLLGYVKGQTSSMKNQPSPSSIKSLNSIATLKKL